MRRLGEILIRLGQITEEQLHEGLANQVLYGGRLGTNLVELGHVELDGLAKGLARRHRLPAVLGSHFDHCDVGLQRCVPPEVAGRWRAVPIGRLAHDASRIAVAVRDPLPEAGRVELARHLGVEPTALVCAVAPELRIHYHLERSYDLPRGNRFMRVKSRVPTDLPTPPELDDSNVEGWRSDGDELLRAGDQGTPSQPPMTLDDSVEIPIDVDDGPAPATASRPGEDPELDTKSDPALRLDFDAEPTPDGPTDAERRRFVPSLADGAALARIAVRQVASDASLRVVDKVPSLRPRDPDELARAVRRAPSRDRVAELVLNGLAEVPGATLDAAAILVVRPPLAIGWKGYSSAGIASIETLAVPLDQAGVVADAYRTARIRDVTFASVEASVIDERMWTVLGGPAPSRAVAAPISIGERVVCILYVQTCGLLGPAESLLVNLSEAAGVAFGRLLRAAQR